jgi:CheY-like chemotaxis protein
MQRVRLIHWNAAEAGTRAERLRSAGYVVDWEALDPASLRRLREDPPSAVVIDLGRLPSHGRDVALGLRKYKPTRCVPLVFVEGAPEKVAGVQELLPDAIYTTWGEIDTSLRQAIAHPPAEPVVPRSSLDGYVGRPLPIKLGIKAKTVVALAGAPEGFEETLGELPDGVLLHRQTAGQCDLILWFVRSGEHLDRGMVQMAALAQHAPLWIAWPKKASGVVTDLSQQRVRATGLAAGLVDYKVCSIDATWSALLFTQRKAK